VNCKMYMSSCFGCNISWYFQATGGGKKEAKEGHEYLFKVLIIGELGTGKTSIIKRYVHQFFSEHYRATVSFASLC